MLNLRISVVRIFIFLTLILSLLSFDSYDSHSAELIDSAETKHVEVSGTKYSYREYGNQDGLPLIMMQRFRGTMDDWDPSFLESLAKDRKVIVFNSKGVASTSGTVPTTIQGMSDSAVEFIEALGLKKVDLLGWSMAGFTAQVLAIEHPQLINKLILLGTGPGGSDLTPPPGEGVFEVATTPEYQEKEHQHLFFTDSPKGQKAMKESIERIKSSRGGKLEPQTSVEVMQNQAKAITSYGIEAQGDYFNKLKTIEIPTLIINGDRDAFFNMDGQNLLYRQIPNSQLAIYPMTGHAPHHEYPESVAELINVFLSE